RHLRRPRHERHERADDRDEASEDHRLAAVLLEERVRAIEILLVQQARARLKHTRSDETADAVVDRVAGEGGGDEQRQHRRDAQFARRAQGAGREQQRVAWKKRRDDESGLREDDREQNRVDPRPVVADELEQVPVEMEDEVDRVHQTASSAWARSSFKSSMSSMPAEMRTRPSVMPMRARVSG